MSDAMTGRHFPAAHERAEMDATHAANTARWADTTIAAPSVTPWPHHAPLSAADVRELDAMDREHIACLDAMFGRFA